MAETEYRIIPFKTFIADMYLQFKDVEIREKGLFKPKEEKVEVWRFVPEDTYAYVNGLYLTSSSCPVELPSWREGDFMHSFHKLESFNLIPFAKGYPDIEEYFKYLREKREEYLQEEAEAENASTIYLNNDKE